MKSVLLKKLALCNKTKLDEYIEVHNEMYEILKLITDEANSYQERTGKSIPWAMQAEIILGKARGEQNA